MSQSSTRRSGLRFIIVMLPNLLYFLVLILILVLMLFFLPIPWQLLPGTSLLSLWRFIQLVVGQVMLILGVMFITWGVTSLGLVRAQGGEIDDSPRTATFVTSGAYAYCRHPQTLGFIFATPAFALIFDFVPLLLVAVIYTPLQLALLLYEERELIRRFGDRYREYRESVRFIIPRRRTL